MGLRVAKTKKCVGTGMKLINPELDEFGKPAGECPICGMMLPKQPGQSGGFSTIAVEHISTDGYEPPALDGDIVV